MNNTTRDYCGELNSLMRRIMETGAFSYVKASNGEYDVEENWDHPEWADSVLACDEGVVVLRDTTTQKSVWLQLAAGNEAGVLCSDYVCHELLDDIMGAHYDEWQGRW